MIFQALQIHLRIRILFSSYYIAQSVNISELEKQVLVHVTGNNRQQLWTDRHKTTVKVHKGLTNVETVHGYWCRVSHGLYMYVCMRQQDVRVCVLGGGGYVAYKENKGPSLRRTDVREYQIRRFGRTPSGCLDSYTYRRIPVLTMCRDVVTYWRRIT